MNRFNLICKSIAAFLAGASVINAAQDQNNLRAPISAQEYIQSVSPLAGGGTVMSRTTPDRGTQTITTIANLPVAGRASPNIGYQPRAVYNGQWTGAAANGGVTPQQPTYVYPATASSSVGFRPRPTNTLGLEPIGNRQYQQTSAYQTGYQSRYAQNCETCGSGVVNPNPNLNPIPNFSPVQMNPTSTTVGTPPAVFGEPALSAPSPQWPPLPQSSPTTQSWTNPGMQYDFNAPWNQPNATPTRSNYTPLFSLRNLPPGTYIGQGLLGQPKAYIDGEPIRNLLRYMSY